MLLVAGELDALCDDASALAAVSPGLVQSVEVAGDLGARRGLTLNPVA